MTASALMVPYLALLIHGRQSPLRGWLSTVAGLVSALAWYGLGYKATSFGLSGLAAPGFWAVIHPLVIGLAVSLAGFALAVLLERFRPALVVRPLTEERS